VSNADTKADVARGDHEDVPSLLISGQTGHFINWKRTKGPTALLREAGYLLLGLVSLATVTGLYFWLDVPLVAAAFTYLIVLVLLSLVCNLSSLIVLSFIGVCCLSYFFAPPIYSFRVDYAQDLITISAFVITAFVVNFLVTRVRGEQRDHMRTCETLREANQRLEVANRTLRIENLERKRAERALRESEAKIRRLVDSNIIGIFFSGLKGRILEANEAFLHLVGHDRDDLVSGRVRWTDLTPPEWRERDRRALAELSSNTIAQPYEKEFFRKGGSRVRVLIGGALFEEGGHEGVAFVVDLTERKRAEEALRESERSSRSALDGIAGLIAILAANGEIETVNRQVFEYFGRPLEWIKNWGTNDAVHPQDLPRVLELVGRGIASGSPFNFELRLRRFDGEYRRFENRHVAIRDDSGRIARWYVLMTDIHDRAQALARLDQMQSDFAHMNRVSMMGELAASLSHEITQPIASARNNARAAQNFIDMHPPDLSEVREALSCVVGDTDRAGDIVDRIRDHIKKTPPRKEHFDLNEAINEVIVLGRSAIIKNGVWVQTRLSEGLFATHGDRVQLQQVVLNLILNAAEAMGSVEGAPRDLLISTEQHRAGVLVAVRDSGPGIDPAHFERVFEAFYTTKSRGVGMGLSICRSIIDAHGGRLWAEANEPRGTIFQFTLPSLEAKSSIARPFTTAADPLE
jgi:PAS domain S-box-containing protein